MIIILINDNCFVGMAGYPLGLKKEQLKVVVEFLSVRNVFALPLGLGRAPFMHLSILVPYPPWTG